MTISYAYKHILCLGIVSEKIMNSSDRLNMSHFYIAANDGIYKTNENFTTLQNYGRGGAGYRGIYFNETSDTVYVISQVYQTIDIFYRNLTFIESISLSATIPTSLGGKNGKLYVGTFMTGLLIIENKSLINTINVCKFGIIKAILIDENDYLGILCDAENKIYLYYTNGTNTMKNINVPTGSTDMKFDPNGRLIISSSSSISIYY